MAHLPSTSPDALQRELRPRLLAATVVLVGVFLVLLVRLYQLQILRGDEFKEKADENFVKELRVPADRGQVLDRRGKVLVDSRPSYDVTLTPYFCGKQCDDVLSRLATMLQLSQDEIDRARTQLANAKKLERFRPFTVKIDITRDELEQTAASFKQAAGFDVETVNSRQSYVELPLEA